MHWRLCSEGPAVLEAQYDLEIQYGSWTCRDFRGPLTELMRQRQLTYKGWRSIFFT